MSNILRAKNLNWVNVAYYGATKGITLAKGDYVKAETSLTTDHPDGRYRSTIGIQNTSTTTKIYIGFAEGLSRDQMWTIYPEGELWLQVESRDVSVWISSPDGTVAVKLCELH